MQDEMTPEQVLARMNQLRLEYLGRLPAELNALQTLADGFCGTENGRAELEALAERLHKLSGSGGTFGLPTLSEHARVLERRIAGWLREPVLAVSRTARQILRRELGALQAALSYEGDEPG